MKAALMVIVMIGIFSCTGEFVSPEQEESFNFYREIKIDSVEKVHYLPERFRSPQIETFELRN